MPPYEIQVWKGFLYPRGFKSGNRDPENFSNFAGGEICGKITRRKKYKRFR
jgi:hypothetical protein